MRIQKLSALKIIILSIFLTLVFQEKVFAASLTNIQINETLSYKASPGTTKLTVTGTYSDATIDPNLSGVTWSTSDPTIATVTSGGDVTFTGNTGNVDIIVQASGLTDTVSVNVTTTPSILGTLIYSSTPLQLSFIDTYTDGSTRLISGTTWTTSDTNVATVSSIGQVTFKNKQGSVTIMAQSGAKTANVSTTVPFQGIKINQTSLVYSSLPSPVQLTVSGVNYDGTQMTVASGITWSASPSSVASVDSTGKVTFTGINGSVTVTAQYLGNSTSVVATINVPKTLVSLTINNGAPLTYSGTPVTLPVKGNYSDSTNTILTSGLTWTSSNTSVATVSSTGIVTFSGRNGNVTITVQSGSVTASVSTTVNITANSIVIESTGTFVYSSTPVTLRAKDGSTVLNNVTWTSSDSSIATVNNGTVTFTGKNGAITIFATYGDKTANISTTVSLVAASVVIKGTLAYSVTSVQLSAEVTWPDSTKNTVTNAVWSSSDSTIATISSSGQVSYTGNTGPLTIYITYANQTASLYSYIVNTNQVVNLRINQALFYSATPVTLTLTGTLSNGNTQTVSVTSAVWTSSDTTVATVNNGVVTYSGKNGALTISATYNNRVATQYVFVNSSIVLNALIINETLTYNPSPVSLSLFATLVNGQYMNVTRSEAVWTSSDPTIATVNNGVVSFTGKNGALTITANYGNKTASVSTTVVNTISSLRINESLNYSPNPVSLTLTGNLANGTTQYISNAVWTSNNTAVATVNNGVVTFTGTSGYVTITATYGGKSASVYTTVTVQANNPFSSNIVNKITIENYILLKIRNTPGMSTITNYTDADQHWAKREIKIAKKLGLVSGYPDNTFKPDDNVTRGEFVVMVSNIFNIPQSSYSSNNFKDISNHFARGYITSLNSLGVIGGYSDRSFKPDDKITRAEVVTILSKLININQVPSSGSTTFYDTNGHWAANGIRQISSLGLLSGNGSGKFAPDDNTTRAEAISLLLRTIGLDNTIKTSLNAL